MRAASVAAGALLLAAAGCGGPESTRAVIGADAPAAVADRPVRLTVSGLAPEDEVTVTATAADARGARWRGHATFRADGRGRIDLARARPLSGTYSGVDGMGLFWSMRPPAGKAEEAWFDPGFSGAEPSYDVTVTVTADGRRLAQRTLTRRLAAPGVTRRTFTPGEDGVSGELFLPPDGRRHRPAVIVIGGSEGGDTGPYEGALLASNGHPALVLAYFRAPGLPAALKDIPLEYFARAARLLVGDFGRVVVRGHSRGSEAALLMGRHYPGLVRGVIACAPSADVLPGFPRGGDAWTRGGRPVPGGTIPLDGISGPVLAIAGTDDRVWRSASSARQIMDGLAGTRDRFPHQAAVYPGAGHGICNVPYLPQGTGIPHPVTGDALAMGGSRPADAAARAQAWSRILTFLAALER
ncbi:acyl-CoA thioesterase/bile acid-CoA:amino acid N-acyltransferase family protein [Actinomadura sp. 21ATH]|uniref:acyl-CoA thioesterase/bile acid-CoA:amino acid N-acyltransferase family protein n=1 Tax=Actinomadura sp. 21ATH TaxID=1735444 RepID=UPI0035C06DD5